MDRLREDFRATIQSDNYKVMSRALLKQEKNFFKFITRRIKSFHELMHCMVSLEKKKWRSFLEDFTTDELNRLLLKNSSWIDAVQNRNNYRKDFKW